MGSSPVSQQGLAYLPDFILVQFCVLLLSTGHSLILEGMSPLILLMEIYPSHLSNSWAPPEDFFRLPVQISYYM